MPDVLLVNPYIFPVDLRGKEEWGANYAINFGILSIANFLKDKGISVEIFDAQLGAASIKKLCKIVSKEQPLILGIGCISSLSFLPSIEIAKTIKKINKNIFVIIGGQHTSFFPEELLQQYDCIDAVAVNESEQTLEQLVHALKKNMLLSSVGGIFFRQQGKIFSTLNNLPLDLNELPDIDYSNYPNYKNFFPLIEESRGCGFKCVFCTNENFYSSIRFKSGQKVFSEIEKTSQLYGSNDLPLVLQCSNYGYNLKESKKLFGLIKKAGLMPRVIFSTRVDGPWKQFIKWTTKYLDQIRFGLESGSPTTLIRMGKTNNPQHYLKRASEAFESFNKEEITTVTNVLYGFCGDSKKTLLETEKFLHKNKKNLSCIRAHPLMDFPGSPYSNNFSFYKKKYGSSRVIAKLSKVLRTYPVNPTKTLTFNDALKQSHKLMQDLNSFDEYYEYYKWTSPGKHRDGAIDFCDKNKLLKDIQNTTAIKNQDFHF